MVSSHAVACQVCKIRVTMSQERLPNIWKVSCPAQTLGGSNLRDVCVGVKTWGAWVLSCIVFKISWLAVSHAQKGSLSQVCPLTFEIPVPGRWKQEVQEFKNSLGCIVNLEAILVSLLLFYCCEKTPWTQHLINRVFNRAYSFRGQSPW